MNLFLFAGAGTSAELGVPVMREMALDLLAHMVNTSNDVNFLGTLRGQIEEASADLELVIEHIDKPCDAGDVLPTFGAAVDPKLVEAAHLTRAEIEWFVQHTCERVQAQAASALWGPFIGSAAKLETTIATTNYDRAIELACQRSGTPVLDGFASFGEREWAEWSGHEAHGLHLLKLHGSTDWYQVRGTGSVVKLRHPMPHFGGVTLHVDNSALGALGSALVLPSREKRKNMFPFPHISHELFTAAKQADAAVFIGTSLRDPDIRSLADECAKRVPTMVVGPHLRSGDGLVPDGATVVQDFASGFLISTLPTIIAKNSWSIPDPARSSSGIRQPAPILDDVVILSDPNSTDESRCAAIEGLWNGRVGLGTEELMPLIASGVGRVARDALALIPLSRDQLELMSKADDLLPKRPRTPDFVLMSNCYTKTYM